MAKSKRPSSMRAAANPVLAGCYDPSEPGISVEISISSEKLIAFHDATHSVEEMARMVKQALIVPERIYRSTASGNLVYCCRALSDDGRVILTHVDPEKWHAFDFKLEDEHHGYRGAPANLHANRVLEPIFTLEGLEVYNGSDE